MPTVTNTPFNTPPATCTKQPKPSPSTFTFSDSVQSYQAWTGPAGGDPPSPFGGGATTPVKGLTIPIPPPPQCSPLSDTDSTESIGVRIHDVELEMSPTVWGRTYSPTTPTTPCQPMSPTKDANIVEMQQNPLEVLATKKDSVTLQEKSPSIKSPEVQPANTTTTPQLQNSSSPQQSPSQPESTTSPLRTNPLLICPSSPPQMFNLTLNAPPDDSSITEQTDDQSTPQHADDDVIVIKPPAELGYVTPKACHNDSLAGAKTPPPSLRPSTASAIGQPEAWPSPGIWQKPVPQPILTEPELPPNPTMTQDEIDEQRRWGLLDDEEECCTFTLADFNAEDQSQSAPPRTSFGSVASSWRGRSPAYAYTSDEMTSSGIELPMDSYFQISLGGEIAGNEQTELEDDAFSLGPC
eukprot:TRINITY_DN68541_c0_g1_i1.p1 TRINITY_DN68541_c0_g1~~TRINITY_DN68541_c0_g1_i1.p1  ORF type:complete len:472 (-),score=52.07 TRINITY_DN68541_c0_g1_i1:9-1235(-)